MSGSTGRCRKNNSRLSNWVEVRAYWSKCETVALQFDIPLSHLLFFSLFLTQASAIQFTSICSYFSIVPWLSVWESGTIKSTTHQRLEGSTMTVTLQPDWQSAGLVIKSDIFCAALLLVTVSYLSISLFAAFSLFFVVFFALAWRLKSRA